MKKIQKILLLVACWLIVTGAFAQQIASTDSNHTRAISIQDLDKIVTLLTIPVSVDYTRSIKKMVLLEESDYLVHNERYAEAVPQKVIDLIDKNAIGGNKLLGVFLGRATSPSSVVSW